MKLITKLLQISIISLFYIASMSSLQAEEKQAEHNHGHNHSQSERGDLNLTLNDGNKWKTDKPLRKGMQNIHQIIMQAEKPYSSKTLTQKEGEKLGSEVNKELMYLVENCELTPKADATLHILIGEMMQGINVLSESPESEKGFPRIHNAVQQYPKYFDHPDWEK